MSDKLKQTENKEIDCDHGDIDQDDMVCLDCDKDMREEIMSSAYDRAKDLRKYGE